MNDLKQRVLAAARRTPSAVRAEAFNGARTVVQRAFALSLAVFFAVDCLHHAGGRPPWFVATSFGAWASVAAMAARGAWRFGASYAEWSTTQLVTVAVATPLLLSAVSLVLTRLVPPAPGPGDGLVLRCFGLTVAVALHPLVGLAIVRRRSDPLHPIAGGAALGAATGASAGALVDAWCPVTAAPHVLAGHVLPVAALVMIGAVIGDRIIAMRGRAPRIDSHAERHESCEISSQGDGAWGERIPRPRRR